MTILEEMEAEAWHILTTIYTYQRLMEGLTNSSTSDPTHVIWTQA